MHDREIIPAVIPTSLEHLRESLAKLKGKAPSCQIDLVDGLYAGEPSWPFSASGPGSMAADLRTLQPISLEFDLMVRDHMPLVPHLVEAGAARIVFHFHDHGDLAAAIASVPSGIDVGIALRNDDPVEGLAPYAGSIAFVQCMGIRTIGVQGQPFDERVLAQIRAVRMLYPGLPVSVDGGVSLFTLPILKDAGATRFVAGSSILKASDPLRAYEELFRIANA
jgi:ribulose-phosphate 3-epimerase